MTDATDSQLVGKTRWRRVPILLVPAYAMIAAVLWLAISGTLAVSFAISGTAFDTFADSLTSTGQDTNGRGFYQLGVIDVTRSSTTPLQVQAESIIPNAQLTNLCQSVTVQLPLGLGSATLITRAGTVAGHPVVATGLVTDASSLDAVSASFTDFKVGQDLSGFSNPRISVPVPVGPAAGADVPVVPVPVGTFGQTAATVSLDHLHSTGFATQAATFTLPNLSLSFKGSCP